MGAHLLNAIITLEKELQSQVREESSRASAWRERQLAELAREEQELHTALATVITSYSIHYTKLYERVHQLRTAASSSVPRASAARRAASICSVRAVAKAVCNSCSSLANSASWRSRQAEARDDSSRT